MAGYEDEPRDGRGRWTDGGGAPSQHPNASVSAHAVHDQMKKDVLPARWSSNSAQNVREAERVIRENGFEANVYRNAKSGFIASYSPSQRNISINASKSYWKDPVGNAKKYGDSGQLSSSHPDHILHHEMGHAIYDPPDNFMSNHERDHIGAHVSKYATTNPKEFVSEVHAGMKAGKQYDEKIMFLFHRYARPRTNG